MDGRRGVRRAGRLAALGGASFCKSAVLRNDGGMCGRRSTQGTGNSRRLQRDIPLQPPARRHYFRKTRRALLRKDAEPVPPGGPPAAPAPTQRCAGGHTFPPRRASSQHPGRGSSAGPRDGRASSQHPDRGSSEAGGVRPRIVWPRPPASFRAKEAPPAEMCSLRRSPRRDRSPGNLLQSYYNSPTFPGFLIFHRRFA